MRYEKYYALDPKSICKIVSFHLRIRSVTDILNEHHDEEDVSLRLAFLRPGIGKPFATKWRREGGETYACK